MTQDTLKEYTPDQQRVADYLAKLSNDQIGGGDDPIGFLIAQNDWWRAKCKVLDKALMEVADLATSGVLAIRKIIHEAQWEAHDIGKEDQDK